MSDVIVFISYSHDSDSHRERVLGLSERLRADGIATILDRYVEHGEPDEGWPRWMMNGLETATHVVIVCTETYYRLFRGHEVPDVGKGVDWEGAFITQKIYDARSRQNRFIPIVFQNSDAQYIPEPLRPQYYVLDSKANYERFYDVLLNQLGPQPGPIGETKRKPPWTSPPLEFGSDTSESVKAVPSSTKNCRQTTSDAATDSESYHVTPVEITIDRKFEQFSAEEQNRLLGVIKQLLEITDDIRVVRRREGSIRLTILLTPRQAAQLQTIIMEGQLAQYNILSATKADLRRADLRRVDLSRANLRGADLSGAILTRADLSAADLTQAYLSGCDLSRADLSNANLTGADLSRADLQSANLTGATLSGSDFTGANCGWTIFGKVDVSNVRGLDKVRHDAPSILGVDSIYQSKGRIPEKFALGCGVPLNFLTYMPSLVSAEEAFHFYSCFISYSHRDQAFAEKLYSRMRQEHLRVWYAPEDMKSGQKIHEQIDKAIGSFDKLLLVLSKDSMQSEWVTTEIRKALKVQRMAGERKLFPVRLVDFDSIRGWEAFDPELGNDLAAELREYHIPDFSNWEDDISFDAALAKLLKDLRAGDES
jgi:hypothetical protein